MDIMAKAPRVMPAVAALLAVLAAASPATFAAGFYFAVDVPSRLGGAEYTPRDIITSSNGVYSLQLQLPDGAELASLHRMANGVWLFSPAHPVVLGGLVYEARDVVAYDGLAFSMFLDGSAAGIPDYARIDALFQHPLGGIVVSLDVPAILAGTEFSRSDLVRYQSGFSDFWDAETAGVPPYANVVGADMDGAGTLVVTFDVPTRVSGIDYLPGQLVGWDGAALTTYLAEASWPASAQLRDFSFVPGAGSVPDGSGAGEVPLTVMAAGSGSITLSWGASCSTNDSDYEIYEGIIGTYYSHQAMFCSTGGAVTMTFAPSSANTYYLVVPRNAVSEGSYGLKSNGSERPRGSTVCLPQVINTTCRE